MTSLIFAVQLAYSELLFNLRISTCYGVYIKFEEKSEKGSEVQRFEDK